MTPEGPSGFWDTYRAPRSDPRTIVTPDAFSVHPSLLGIPLAQHSRRVVAILADLLLVAIVTQLGGLLLGILAVIFLFRATFKKKDDARAPSIMGTAFRGVVGCFGFLVLLVTVMVLVGTLMSRTELGEESAREIRERVDREVREQMARDPVTARGLGGFLSLVAGTDEVRRFRRAETEEEARRWAEALATRGRELDVTPEDVREILREFAPADAPWRGAVDSWVLPGEEADPEPEGPPEAEAPEVEDAAPDPTEPQEALDLPPELADTLQSLEERLAAETHRRATAEAEAEEAREALRAARQEAQEASRFPGIRAVLRRIADDLGVGFGWAALYFTVFTTWWNGRTPGKRLARIRVVKLSGEPLTWWDSFERYGGYAAGFATGLLGFIQVYWDPNRQAIHDRIGRTVVVQDGKPPVPGRWNAASQKPGGPGDPEPHTHRQPGTRAPGSPAGPVPRTQGKAP